MRDLCQVQGLLTVFSDVSTAEAVTHNNILLHLISSAASSCGHRRSQAPRRTRLLTQSIPLPLGAGAWTKGPCMNPSFLWLAGRNIDFVSCACIVLQQATSSIPFPALVKICRVLTVHQRFTIEFCGCSKFPAAAGSESSGYTMQKPLSSPVIMIAGSILAPTAFQCCLSLPGLCAGFCHLLIPQILFCTQVGRVL